MSTPPSCRLSVLLARAAPVGVIFRRGPAKWVQIIQWDTATNTFTPGQWFHGKIDAERSDLSPDGSKLLYFAIKLNGRTISDPEYGTSWTAISRPPYLTALALWPTGYAWGWTYNGGGLFLSNTEIWLDLSEDAEAHPNHTPQGLAVRNRKENPYGGRELAEDKRRARDGWERIQEWQTEDVPGIGPVTLTPRIDRKQSPHRPQALILTTNTADYKRREAYAVEDGTGAQKPLTGVDWADWDHRGRLVFAQKGKILTQDADAIGREPPTELIDLNGNTFENVVRARVGKRVVRRKKGEHGAEPPCFKRTISRLRGHRNCRAGPAPVPTVLFFLSPPLTGEGARDEREGS